VWDADTLEVLVRGVGLVTAMLGAAAAVPGAVWRLKDKTAAKIKAIQTRLWRHPIDVRNQTGHAYLGVHATATAKGIVAASGLDARIAALEQQVRELEGSVREVKGNLQVEIETRKDADTRLANQIGLLRTAIHDLEKVSTEIDANAFLIVVFGIVLTSISDWLASNFWVAVISVAVGVGSWVFAVLILERSRHRRERS
jgi:hypothetical protein